ncbi:TetR/AcrR family transcriptional regulator C-terminal domain-containing protein [Streptomyces sp. NPDC003077]|uniref:TetR/AcrR family transcriptional regulator n=1 Tax=Streptomyces sp. NPDC003077 TaxID=3154443 RepID=UPI0033BDA1A6
MARVPAGKSKQVPSVWVRQREQRALSREQIVSEAVRLLDAEGIDALSMRKLSASLGAGATSLYRHVANKDELIELVIDEVYGELDLAASQEAAHWREDTAAFAQSLRALILRHPWIASVLGEMGMAYLGPNMMRLTDRLLAMFERAGFPLDEADNVVGMLFAYVTGTATSEAAWLTKLARTGVSEQEQVTTLWPAAEAAAQQYPRLREGYTHHKTTDPAATRDANFTYGLARILDGLEARLNRLGTGSA